MIFHFEKQFLVTRGDGVSIRERLEAALREADRTGTDLELDFSEVTAMTHSFVDECLGRLLSKRAAGDLPPVLMTAGGLNDETAEEIDIALSRRKLGLVRIDGDRPVLLGADDYLKETFDQGAAREEFRAADLAEELGTTPQNMNNRLKALVDSGALRRVRSTIPGGGREFVYQVARGARLAPTST